MANGSATTRTNLNLRSGPSASTTVLWTIPAQTSVTLTGIPNNGWYPVTVNGNSGFVSGDYLTGITPYTDDSGTGNGTGGGTGGGVTTGPPPVLPTPEQMSNPFYKPTSMYGSTQNWYDTPIVRQSSSFDQEYEKYLTDQGFGGLNQKGDFARSLADRAKAGFGAAQLNNPALTNRQYLADLGSDFLERARAAATPVQRGEQWAVMAPRSRWTPR